LLVSTMGGTLVPDGGSNLLWVLLMLWLTIISWLFAPFIFNPYQFSFKYFRDDVASLRGFFVADGSRKWVEWYETTQLKPGVGLRVTIMDIFYWLFIIGVWFTSVGAKMHIFETLFPSEQLSVIFANLPPIICTTSISAIAAALEPCLGFIHGRDSRAAPSFHLVVAAPTCALCLVFETFATVWFLIDISWWKSVVTVIILKYFFMSMLLSLVEGLVSLRWIRTGYFRAFFRLWLYSHRMAMDLVVSLLIFCTTLPLVAFDYCREQVCKGYSIHNMLVFRSPGAAMFRGASKPSRTFTAPTEEDCAVGPDELAMSSRNMAAMLKRSQATIQSDEQDTDATEEPEKEPSDSRAKIEITKMKRK